VGKKVEGEVVVRRGSRRRWRRAEPEVKKHAAVDASLSSFPRPD
jgi:hypothetical protein